MNETTFNDRVGYSGVVFGVGVGVGVGVGGFVHAEV